MGLARGCYPFRVARLTDKQMQRIASALAEPRRFKMLQQLSSQGNRMTCSAMVECHDVSNATISHHLKELENAELIELVREGKYVTLLLRRATWDAYLARLSEL